MAWIYLLIAGGLEIGWALGLKYSDGFSKPLPSLLTVIGMVLSVIFLALAVRSLPIGTAYAVWTGIGAAGTVILGIVLLNESADIVRLACVALIVMGVIGLKVLSPA